MAQNAPFSPDDILSLLRQAQDPATGLSLAEAGRVQSCSYEPVSYTHLTLPTILLV